MSISTLEIARELEERGFTHPQAEVLAEQFMKLLECSNLVTKDCLSSVTAQLETKLVTEISNVRAEMHTEFGSVRAEIGNVRAETINAIGHLKSDLLKTFITLQFGSLGVICGLVYFLAKH